MPPNLNVADQGAVHGGQSECKGHSAGAEGKLQGVDITCDMGHLNSCEPVPEQQAKSQEANPASADRSTVMAWLISRCRPIPATIKPRTKTTSRGMVQYPYGAQFTANMI